MRAKFRLWPSSRRSSGEDDAAAGAPTDEAGRSHGIRQRFLAWLLRPIAPALVGESGGLPEVDSRAAADGASEMICGGPLEAFLTVVSGIITLNLLAVLTKGRLLKSLDPDSQAKVLSRAFNSRLFLLRGAGVIVGLPLKVAYYNTDDVCRELGYDRCLLIEDALKHQVTRGL